MPRALLLLAVFVSVAPAAHADPEGDDQRLANALTRAEANATSVRAAIDLWRLVELADLAGIRARKRMVHTLKRIARGRASPLPLRRLALRMLARSLRADGDVVGARRAYDRLGALRDWWLIGPFDNQGHRGFDTAYDPELGIDLDRPAPGKRGPVSWRPAPTRPSDGTMWLHPLFQPREKAVAYGLCVVRLTRPAPVLLHASCDDGCKVWVNRTLVLEDPGLHPQGPDQHAVQMQLARGDHRMLIKVAQDEGAWGFSLSMTDPRGRAVRGLSVLADPQALRASLGGPAAAPRGLRLRPTLASWFQDRADRKPEDPRALAEAALALVRTGAHDVRKRQVQDLVRRATQEREQKGPASADTLLALAEATDDGNLERRLLLEAATLSPRRPEAWSRLGLAHHVRNETAKALQAHGRALAAAPDHLPSLLEQAELLFELGLSGQAHRQLEVLARRHPESPEVLMVAANVSRRNGHVARARELYTRLVRIQADQQLGLRALYEMAVARGDLEAADAWMGRLLELDPLRAGWWIEHGDQLLHNERAEDAAAAYRRAVEICPENPLALVREGLALQTRGDTQAGLERLKAAFELTPQDLALERRIRRLEPRGTAFYEPYRLGLDDLTEGDAGVDAGALRLLESTVVRLHGNGMTSRFRQQIVKILDKRGADRLRAFRIEYAPSRQQVRILTSRITHADGTTDAGVLVNDYSLSEPWYNLYYDIHAREVSFPTLSPGDRVELSYQVDDVGTRSLLGQYFGDLVPMQFAEPAGRIVYILLAPRDLALFHNTPAGTTYHKEPAEGDTVIHRWDARQVPAVEPEPDMPGFTETHRFLHVSSHRNWEELARWYGDQIADPLVAGPDVKRLAASLTGDLTDPQDKVRTLYRFVSDSTRYVGLEFGIHSYVPYLTSQVLKRRFGDCKDKSALLTALLREVGVPAQLALVRMSRLGHVPANPASLAVFNHAVTYVPGQDLWLDATVSYHDVRDLPPQDQDVPALVIGDDGGHLTRTPVTSALHNRTEIAFHVRPAEDGTAQVDARVAVTGTVAPAVRAQLIGSGTRRATLEKIMNELFPGARLTSMEVENLERPELPLVTQTEMTVPVMARGSGQAIDVPALGRGTSYQKIFTPYQARQHDLLLAPPWSVGWTVRVAPPTGYQPERLPDAGEISEPFGVASISYVRDGADIRIQAEFRLGIGRVPASEYQAFRDFLGNVDRLFGHRLRFVKGESGGR